jgi:cell division GTPase FtsZ
VQEIADPDAMIVWGMSFDESYEGEVKVTIVATGFPDNIQQAMIKNVGLGMSNKFNMPTTPLSGGSMTNNFVSRAMHGEGINSQSQSDYQSMQQPKQPEVDLETPAFLRRKLLG